MTSTPRAEHVDASIPARRTTFWGLQGVERNEDPRVSHTTIAPPAPVDEVWVIARPESASDSRASNLLDQFGDTDAQTLLSSYLDAQQLDRLGDVAIDEVIRDGGGSIIGIPAAPTDEEPVFVHVPLEHTEVRAHVAGFVASVNVRQRYHNPYNGKIEAVYVFPLPQNAAVSEFLMTIGERTIRGIIRDREEAEQIYEDARAQGYVASLMTQERPNIFMQRVANIEPGKQIDIDLTYYNTLAYEDGWYRFDFPMVVGPRFNPSGAGDPVNALPYTGRRRSTSRVGAEGTDVHYLRPNERSGHDIALTIDIDAGVEIEDVLSASHVIDTRRTTETSMRVTLSSRDAIPNRDFVLRWRVAGERIKSAMLVQRDSSRLEGKGHFAMMIYPPRSLRMTERAPLEMVFVIDTSGSMRNEPLRLATDAVERALRLMRPGDAFQIIRFSDDTSAFGSRMVEASEGNIARGLEYLRTLDASGGTHMLEGVRAACVFPRAAPERERVIVFLTDGFIGNEPTVLSELHNRLDTARVFSVGIGSSPNRYLLERMAQLGRGAVTYVGPRDSVVDRMELFMNTMTHPAMEDIAIDFGSMEVEAVYPQRLDDLHTDRPIVLTGRFTGTPPEHIRVRGRIGGEMTERSVTIVDQGINDGRARDGIAHVWARTKIADLANRSITTHAGTGDMEPMIRRIALSYGLLSAYTAFVAVDSSRRTEGAHGTTVPVGVPVPEGVKYETTVEADRR